MLYACIRYRNYRIKHLKFQNGLLKVDNANDQKLVENNGFYMAHIFPVTEPDEGEIHYGKKDEESQDAEAGGGESTNHTETKTPTKRETRKQPKKSGNRGRKAGAKGKEKPIR